MRLLLPILILATPVLLTSCSRQTSETAPSGARPAVDFPIGPPPGPDPAIDTLSNPLASNSSSLLQGRRLFVWYNCYGCHGGHGGGGMGPSLRDEEWMYGDSDAAIFSSIAQGRRYGMPAWGLKVPEEQIWHLVTYIQSMDTPREPSPPRNNPSWPQPAP